MAERPRFQKFQYAFAAHIRDPEHQPAPPDVEDRRMAVYRELFFNNISSTLASTFPVLARILSEERWNTLMRDFFKRHQSQTPLFAELPEEFLAYLQTEYSAEPGDPPFLTELAHYEWVELAVDIQAEEPDRSAIDPDGDLLSGCPVLSPLAWPLAYAWPVHTLSPDNQPANPPAQPTFLVVYRDAQDAVQFMEINAITARLLERLNEAAEGDTGRTLLERVATDARQPADAFIEPGRAALEKLRAKGIVLGTHR